MERKFTEQGLKVLQSLASLVACQMCRIKGRDNVLPSGACRHSQGLPPAEVIQRLSYAVSQADNARDLAKAIKQCCMFDWMSRNDLQVVDALKAYDETERAAGAV